MSGISVLTPTSGRPEAFRLCERWMARQSYKGDLQWIVADDGADPAPCTMGQTVIRRQPIRDPAKSFRGNLVAALETVKHDKVCIVEDDDHFHPSFLRCMSLWLDGKKLCGEAHSRYYQVPRRRFHVFDNTKHACLSGTGFRAEVIPWIIERLRDLKGFNIDMKLWREGPVKPEDRLLWPQSEMVVGMKGLPGKQGLGIGHKLDQRHKHDPEGDVLRQWIGKEDAQTYFDLVKG